jgi:hypothetical protein
MNFQIYPFQSINIDSIELGNPFSYGENYNLINLYIKNNDISTSSIYQPQFHKSSFIIQTPVMFIPQNLFFINDRPFLSLSFNNEENDELNVEFKEWINNLEMNCYKLIKKLRNKNNKPFKKLKVNKKQLIPLIKNDIYSRQQKMIIPINLNTSKCVLTHNGLKSKDHYLPDWNITTPTYGFCVVGFKNIWVKDGAWGLNLFCYLTKVMPSHILDPIDSNVDYLKLLQKTLKPTINIIKYNKNDNNRDARVDYETKDIFSKFNLDNIEVDNICKNKVLYQNYFKMRKIGVPSPAIINKIEKDGLNPKVMDLREDEFNLIVNTDNIKLKRNNKVKITLSNDKRKNYSETDEDYTENTVIRQNTMSKYEVKRKDIQNTNINLFNDINAGVKLKKASPLKKKKINKKDSRVPSLNQIKYALKNLNSTDVGLM